MKTKNPSTTALALFSFLAASASAQVAAPGAVSAPGAASSGSVNSAASTSPSTTNTLRTPEAPNPNSPVTPNPVAPIANQNNNATAPQRASGQPLSPDAVPAANPDLAPVDPRLNVVNPNLTPENPNLNAGNPTATAPSDTNINSATTASRPMNGTANSTLNADAARNGAAGTSSSTTNVVNSSLAESAATQGDLPAADVNRRNANVRANATVNGQNQPMINGLATGAELSAGAIAVLSPAETVQDIRSATPSSRDALYSQINTRIENNGRIISDLDHQARALRGDAKTEFNAAASNLRDSEKSLKRSLNDVRKASNDTWSDAQARLATDYQAYAVAVARAQAAVNAGTAAAKPGMSR